MNKEKLSLWNLVEETDPYYTKQMTTGAKLTSINAQYLFKKATSQFGPYGAGWGADIKEERFDEGPLCFYFDNDGNRIDVGHEKTHTVIINFFYLDEEGKRHEFIQYGHTPYMYFSHKYKQMNVDHEAPKKSFTDAIKKALSMLGFGADIHMGEYETAGYQEAVAAKVNLDKQENKVVAMSEAIADFDAWYKREMETYDLLPNLHSVKLCAERHLQEIKIKCQKIGINPEKYVNNHRKIVDETKTKLKEKQ